MVILKNYSHRCIIFVSYYIYVGMRATRPTKHPKTEAKISIFILFFIPWVKKAFKMAYL